MKIWLAAIDAHGGGGVTTHLKNVTKSLVSMGHEVQWVTPAGQIVEDIAKVVLGVNQQLFDVYPNNRMVDIIETWAVRLTMNMLLLLAESKPDIIHCHDIITFNRVKNIAGRYGIPILLTVHGYIPEEEVHNGHVQRDSVEHRYWMKTEWFALKEADKVLAVGTELKEYLLSVYPEAKIDMLPNPIDEAFSGESQVNVKKELGIPEESFLVFCPSRYAFNKGVEYLIEAFAHTPENVYLLLVDHGTPALYNELDKHKLNHRVKIIKPVSHESMSVLYKAVQVCVIPSVHAGLSKETSSYTAIESMVCGTPVIASNIGGLKEVIGEHGILVPERDSMAITEAIKSLLDPKKYSYWKETCRIRGEEFLSGKVVGKLVEHYHEVLEKEKQKYHTPFIHYGFSAKVLAMVYAIILEDFKELVNILDMAHIRFGAKYREALRDSLRIVGDNLPADYNEIKQAITTYLYKVS